MAKGGGSQQPQSQTVTQTNLPEYARPYFENLMQRSQSLLSQGYTPYGQERIAGFTPQQQALQRGILDQQTPGEFGTAAGLASLAGMRSLDASNYATGQFGAQQINQPNLQQFQMGPAMQVTPYQSPQQGQGFSRQGGGAAGRGFTEQVMPDGTVVTTTGRMPEQQPGGGAAGRGFTEQVMPDGTVTTTTGRMPDQPSPQQGQGQGFPQQGGGAAPGQGAISPQMQAAQTGFSPQVQAFMMGNTRDVGAQEVSAPMMEGARTSFGQGPLEQFRMSGPQMFGSEQAQQYMSPFLEQALEPQLRSAVSDARRAQVTQDLGAARQGTYGGSRQLLASMEREKNLGQQMGDIRARGMQSAFENAQQQFERDRAAGMTTGQQNLEAALRQQQLGTQTGLQSALANLSNEQQSRVNNQAMQFQAQGMNQEQAMRAALANQGVDVTRAQANQQAQMQAQQLGTQTGAQVALANLDARSQANVQNLAAQLQTQGLNADQALRAALANQQAGLQVGQQNLQAMLQTQQLGAQTGLEALRANQQADLERQRMREQSRQFGAQQGLAGLAQAGQMGQTLTNIGSARSQADQARFGLQTQTAAQQQALQQQFMDMAYQDFLRQRDFPLEMLQQYSSLLRGVPVEVGSTRSTYAQQPGIGQQLLGTGLGAASLYNTFAGGR